MSKAFQGIMKNINRNLEEASLVIERKMHDIVAIDTGILDESIQVRKGESTTTSISNYIGSRGVDYAKYVEFSDRKKTYSRGGVVVYTGVGQKWAQRAVKETEEQVRKIFSKP